MLCSIQGKFTLHTAFTIYAVGYAKKTAHIFFIILAFCVTKVELNMAKCVACLYPYASQVGR
jgi:hypothetical protein